MGGGVIVPPGYATGNFFVLRLALFLKMSLVFSLKIGFSNVTKDSKHLDDITFINLRF